MVWEQSVPQLLLVSVRLSRAARWQRVLPQEVWELEQAVRLVSAVPLWKAERSRQGLHPPVSAWVVHPLQELVDVVQELPQQSPREWSKQKRIWPRRAEPQVPTRAAAAMRQEPKAGEPH